MEIRDDQGPKVLTAVETGELFVPRTEQSPGPVFTPDRFGFARRNKVGFHPKTHLRCWTERAFWFHGSAQFFK